jgi:eukaryotic-like serine/threonine-protein kinase
LRLHDRFAVGATTSIHFGWLVRDGLVCVKRMHPFSVATEGAVRISHPNVVATYGIVRRPGELLAAMEYVPGASLAEILESARGLEPRIAASILTDVLRGLHAAHETRRSVIPRGLSPSSIIVGEDGRARLIDLDVRGPASPAAIIDKLPYAAAEQVETGQEGERVDVRRDVWAAGVVLWEALSGRSLFRAGTIEQTLHAIRWKPIPEIDPELDAIISRAVARNPGERFASARAMATDLARASCASHDEVALALSRLDLGCISRRRVLADAVTRRERRDLHIECTKRIPKA